MPRKPSKLPSDTQISRVRNLFDLKLVEVDWLDAMSDSRWQGFDDAREAQLVECKTVGRLTKNTKKEIQVAASINMVGAVGDITTIPQAWVKKVRFLA
jgi:hypothetical protein